VWLHVPPDLPAVQPGQITVLALCAGIGGLEEGIRRATPARTVCYVESDPFAACVLASRMAEGACDTAPVWSDLRAFDGRPWRGRVDCIAAGFPCQPASVAGKRGGACDDRWLWPDVARVISAVRPSIVFLENVPGLLTVDDGWAFHSVLTDLAALGFVGRYDLFRASDVGAPHWRERLFLLARVPDAGSLELRHESGRLSRARGSGETEPGDVGEGVADADCAGRSRERLSRVRDGERPARGDDPHRCDVWPPGPADTAGWRRWLEAGGPAPATEPRVRRDAHELPGGLDPAKLRADRLRCLGNAVIPAQAELAWRVLSRGLM
jgi:DNA (cytosine-5)-methyltransferase 1